MLVAISVIVFATSCVSGLVGAGGTIIMVPAVIYILPALGGARLDTHVVTSLGLVQGIAVGVGGGYRHWRGDRLNLKLLRTYGPAIACGGVLGAFAAAKTSSLALLVVFAVVTSAATILLWANPRVVEGSTTAGRAIVVGIVFFAIGCLGGLIGVGAGFLTVPLLLYWLGVDIRAAAGTALVFTLLLCFPSLAARAATGQVNWTISGVTAICGIVGAFLGSMLSERLPVRPLRLGLSVVMTAFALRMWLEILFAVG
jgi:uncharacterized membrane protein YfcA